MAKFNIPVVINRAELVLKALENFERDYKFMEDVSEEYKKGHSDCAKHLKDALQRAIDRIADSNSEK